jgi:hypothetical protein
MFAEFFNILLQIFAKSKKFKNTTETRMATGGSK